MTHQNDITIEINRIILSERAARSESVHDLHRLRILDLILTRHWNASRREEAGTENNGSDRIFIRGIAGAPVLISHPSELMLPDQSMERNGRPCGAVEFLVGAFTLHIKGVIELKHALLDVG